jgi:hypothetical protein
VHPWSRSCSFASAEKLPLFLINCSIEVLQEIYM